MFGKIFLLEENGSLQEMNESGYDSEDLLQSLLADYPDLLAGDQIDQTAPRRWLLVDREMPVPSSEGGSATWSLDHLFLDQEAIPTIVEVKRSTDTRIRREVVGQILDYAANAVAYWPIEQIIARFSLGCEKRGREPEDVLMEFLGDESNEDDFWQRAKDNLQAGKVRLVFVADLIPPELQRIVEFLNEQMDRSEVLAVEIKQFIGEGKKTLVPRVIGQTAEAMQKKNVTRKESRKWDRVAFLDELGKKTGQELESVAERIFEWAASKGLRIGWGTGIATGTFYPTFDYEGTAERTFYVSTNGNVSISFGVIKNHNPAFTGEDRLLDLLNRMNSIPGIYIGEEAISKGASFPLSALMDETSLKAFLDIFEWLIAETKSNN